MIAEDSGQEPNAIKTIKTDGNGPSNDILVSVRDLHVWYELKRWGLIHAGYVKAVDGVDSIFIMVNRSELWVRAAAERRL